MIRDPKLWQEFLDEEARREEVDYYRNLAIFEALLDLARALGRWPPEDPLEGIEVDIRVARILNGQRPD